MELRKPDRIWHLLEREGCNAGSSLCASYFPLNVTTIL
jgi:hypothetical protein